MATNIQEIFGIQESILINLVQENLRNCAFAWSKLSPTLYQTNSLLINGIPWDVRVQKVTNSRFYLEVLKCGKIIVAITDNDQVQSLFDTAEEQFSPLENIEEEAIIVLNDCRCSEN